MPSNSSRTNWHVHQTFWANWNKTMRKLLIASIFVFVLPVRGQMQLSQYPNTNFLNGNDLFLIGVPDETNKNIRAVDVAEVLPNVANVQLYGAKGDGLSDDTAAVTAAYDAIKTKGGTLLFPASPRAYLFNLTVLDGNIGIEGRGASVDCRATLQPADRTKPVIQVGNDTGYVRGFWLHNVAIYGYDKNGLLGAGCLRFAGGAIDCYLSQFSAQGGENVLWIEGGGTHPTVSVQAVNFKLRANTDSLRGIIVRRHAGTYTTCIQFVNGHFINTGQLAGYGVELDGDHLYATQVYFDLQSDHGFYSHNGGQLRGNELTLDCGSRGVVWEVGDDTIHDPARYLMGQVFVDNGLLRLSDGTTEDLSGHWGFLQRQYLSGPVFKDSIYITDSTHPFDTSTRLDLLNARGPLRVTSPALQVNNRLDVLGDLQLVGDSRFINIGSSNVTSSQYLQVDFPHNTTNTAQVRFFRSTSTSGTRTITIYKGDGSATPQHHLDANGDTYFCQSVGDVHVGSGLYVNGLTANQTVTTDGSSKLVSVPGITTNFSTTNVITWSITKGIITGVSY